MRRSGRGSTRRAPDGTHVTVRWQTDLNATDGNEDELAEEEDVARFLEDELRVAEADWRRETAARAQVRCGSRSSCS